jgi:signal transduction histidine kinase
VTSHPPGDVSSKLLVLAAVLGLAVLSMAALGYRATQEWRRSAAIVTQRRIDEVDALLTMGLMRDMAGAQSSILMALGSEQIDLDPPDELSEIFARAFARFPYPESFFVWKSYLPRSRSAVWFNRTDRPPVWYHGSKEETLFPVTVIDGFSMADRLALLTQQQAVPGERAEVFETTIDGEPYQVVTRLFYNHSDQLIAVVGFTVNLNWVRTTYFREIIRQMEHIEGSVEASPLSLSIIDDNDRTVSQTRPPTSNAPYRKRSFPFAFFDSTSLPLSALRHISFKPWTARVTTADDTLIGAAQTGANLALMLLLVAAGLSFTGVVLVTYSLKRNFELTAMKADFVAMVTHELKTPLSGISLVGETLTKGRFPSESAIVEYGVLLSRETTRLKRLVENVLSFSRLTSADKIYSFSQGDIKPLALEALERLQPLAHEKSMNIRCEIPDVLPQVECDREEVTRAFENLIENAIKYSETSGKIELRASSSMNKVNVYIQDNGRGIAQEDIPHVFDRFFRGKNAGSGGSGLGLAIAHTIIKDHGGEISIGSVLGKGTLVTVTLPVVELQS